ncbi:MAG: protein kinase [Deltaproteobacteria bacterium]|nr:protein kinase [Deltaproteobacteria bacterium]
MPSAVSSSTSGSSSLGVAKQADHGAAPVAFGKYRLHQRVARGGMGEVYRASLVGEMGFEKPLVIKTILPEFAQQPRFIELFAAEAKTAVALSHGNIVPIYELGRAEDIFYIVMGYVDGPSVAQLLARHRRREHPPPLAVALSIARGVLSGLAYAHTEEPGRPAVVHRDITPRNVMVDRSGQVRIVDFGIARPAHADAGVRGGSIGYIPPEQARGQSVDPRADVFSTGCLLYELLTLERAFPNEGVWTSPAMDRIPETIEPVLRRALSLDPADRPRDASALLQALGEAIARHAATFTEADLAAHLRGLYPQGRWAPSSDPPEDELTPSTAADAVTFATRLTPISKGSSVEVVPISDDDRPATEGSDDAGHTAPAPAPTAAAPEHASRRVAWGLGLGAMAAALVLLLWRPWAATVPERSVPAVTPTPTPASNAAGMQASSTRTRSATTDIPPQADDRRPTTSDTPPPTVVLAVVPANATVRIGTQRFEGGSPFTLPLPTQGTLEALVEHPGHESKTVVLEAGKPGQRTIELKRTVVGRGQLQVLAPSVPWAEVTVDGRRRGNTPTRKFDLPAGSHRVVVRCVPDVCPTPEVLLRKTVEIAPNETTRVSAPTKR